MKKALVIGVVLLTISGTSIKSNNAQVCSLGVLPKLQAYCIKKAQKEKLRCDEYINPVKQAIDNSLHFIGHDILSKLVPF
jgi:hypothetical protein